ncbi:hypothetical protein P691DRAFT_800908 [Macrolepiota fuliginosa MF-IS2]|uniref:DUF1766-domain-containing protein n=1 Tax=Macrolepiota fuliginosa MF-IS2 TaxID=1400762 RepID=A0A9P6C1D8_9AGAR|nr:hypothetical protein P691DRAFT_800908 [Macrolepiota fuliginosa MF-IS2]
MPESRDLKDKAGYLINKFVDIYHEAKNKPTVPPKPTSKPPKPSRPSAESIEPPRPSDFNHLTAAFNGLSISNPSTPVAAQSGPGFIGGFHVAAASSAPALNSPSLPTMPVPDTSLTMQYAMQRPDYTEFVDIPLPPFTPQKPPQPYSSVSPVPNMSTGSPPATNPTGPSLSATPIRPTTSGNGSVSQPSTPSGKSGQVQCAGITKAGKQCTRQVKTDLAGDDAEDGEENILRFCHQHATEVLAPSGYYARKTGKWVIFEEWIPGYLQASTRASLRAEMEKSKSARDVPGYIYTFEIRDPDAPKTIKLKVGRAVNLVKRIDQWGKQCGSKEQVLRGFYPGNVEEDEGSLMKGRVQAGEKAAWCHRLERLIHIELADLVSTCVYLEPGWPKMETSSSPSAVSKLKANGTGNGSNKPCPDCGSAHKEIFEFRRWEKGRFKGKEWEQIVKPVVERWGKFVDLYV